MPLSCAGADGAWAGAGGGSGPDLAGVDAVFIDPARRTGARRLGPGASEPSLAWCLGLAGRVPGMGIKAAPGIARDTVPGGWELEFVAVGRDLKEAVAWSPSLAAEETAIGRWRSGRDDAGALGAVDGEDAAWRG